MTGAGSPGPTTGPRPCRHHRTPGPGTGSSAPPPDPGSSAGPQTPDSCSPGHGYSLGPSGPLWTHGAPVLVPPGSSGPPDFCVPARLGTPGRAAPVGKHTHQPLRGGGPGPDPRGNTSIKPRGITRSLEGAGQRPRGSVVGRGRGRLRGKWAHGEGWVPSLPRDGHCTGTLRGHMVGSPPEMTRHFGGQDGILLPGMWGRGVIALRTWSLPAAPVSGSVVPSQFPERRQSWEGVLRIGEIQGTRV